MKSKQSGFTLTSFLLLLIVVGFFAFMAVKLAPAYLEYYGLQAAMKQLADGDVSGKSVADLRQRLLFKSDFQYADKSDITPQDITVKRGDDQAWQMHMAYDKVIPFIYNIDFLLHFEKSVTLHGDLNGDSTFNADGS